MTPGETPPSETPPGGITTSDLLGALLIRTWRHQGRQALLVPAAAGTGLVALLLVLPHVFPGAVHGELVAADNGLVAVAGLHSATSRALSTALLVAPTLLGVAAALITGAVSRAVVSGDLGSGSMEALLASPVRLRSVYLAYTACALITGALSWLVLVVAFTGLAWVALTCGGSSVRLSSGYLLLGLLVPAASVLWAASATVFTGFRWPTGLRPTAGLGGGLARAVALLPALGATTVSSMLPDAYTTITGWYVGGTLALTAVLLVLMPLVFRVERVLE
ncbi:hypothetical protein [Streptomyces sp. LaPpAH-108]|uniref:hypothetical protein n=1 Tax=Streptomyces sp. LaPpAH-108 TaxID=1155714 RepID=UPI0003662CB4|nr:hypothetical protein [Streptomyces sp. LaPpAH-108]